MFKFHLPLSRLIWLIAIITIAIILMIVIRETLIMQTILSISNPDIKLNKIDE